MEMKRRAMLQGMGAATMFAGLAKLEGQASGGACFELRVYHAAEGKMDDLLKRFREHTMALFAKHGITSVGYWLPTDDGPLKGRTLYYLLKYPSREEGTLRWKAFASDPEWLKVKTASEANGKLTEKTESTFLEYTNFSPKV
jgi:hypothetical protein